MEIDNRYIRFDWAVKRLLRDKANFSVLEGLVTVLLNEPVKITEILESEGNQESEEDKFNRVDIKAKNQREEIIIVEVQLTRELHYLERILLGVSKAITEHIQLGNKYDQVKKVYSISIVYFDLGKGSDYLYHGTTQFFGVHSKDQLKMTSRESGVIRMKTPDEIFPEYFIIRVNEFNNVAKTPLEEWIDYLKNGHIKDDTTTPGLSEARQKLLYLSMSKEERIAYDRHISAVMVQNDVLSTAKLEGLEEGRAQGREEGRKEGRKEGEAETAKSIAKEMKSGGLEIEQIAKFTGLSLDIIETL